MFSTMRMQDSRLHICLRVHWGAGVEIKDRSYDSVSKETEGASRLVAICCKAEFCLATHVFNKHGAEEAA